MSPCKRALLYLCRERKRTLRLTLLFLALTVLMLLCGWVQASMAQNAAQLRQRVGAYFRVSDDAEGRYINDALIEQLKQGGNIRRVSGENLQIMYSESILPVPGMLAARDDPARYMMSYYSGHYSSLEQHFTTGEFTLSVGRHITPADRWAAVISRPLAERNGLVPGDTFTVCHTPERAAEDPSLADGQFHFTIVGIFDIAEAQPSPAQSSRPCRKTAFLSTLPPDMRSTRVTQRTAGTATVRSFWWMTRACLRIRLRRRSSGWIRRTIQ